MTPVGVAICPVSLHGHGCLHFATFVAFVEFAAVSSLNV